MSLLKQHGLWTCVMLVGAIMCIYTGHRMLAESKQEWSAGRP